MYKTFKIPFGELRLGAIAKANLSDCINRNWVSQGKFVKEFEEKFADKFGWKYCIATSSGSMAATISLYALYSKAKKYRNTNRVVTSACAFVSTVNSIKQAGLVPKLVDIDLSSLNMIYSKPDWITQFVANMGNPQYIDELNSAYVLADMCEAHGAKFNHSCCDIAIYSFYTAHILVAGGGGMICTDDKYFADKCRSMVNHGRRTVDGTVDDYFEFPNMGFNGKMSDLNAAVALEGLNNFDSIYVKRLEVRGRLNKIFKKFDFTTFNFNDNWAPHAFPFLIRRDMGYNHFYNFLTNNGIQVKTLFGSLANQSYLTSNYYYPTSEFVGHYGMHIGCHEYITNDDLNYIEDKLEEYFKEKK